MNPTTDIEIRHALHKRFLIHHHKNPRTVVVDELGLSHGKNRIDIAVLNGSLHGYEIKSSKDNLNRLLAQLEIYSKSLQKLTIVSAPNHIEDILSVAPTWSGIILADKGPRGGIHFSKVRSSEYNPDICIISVAHLLWKEEAISYLQHLGVTEKLTNKTRKKLYEYISELSNINELISWIKNQFMSRENWRAVQRPL
jgi:hypothetical protein